MGTNKLVQSMVEKNKGSESMLTKALMDANNVAKNVAKKPAPKKTPKKK